MLRRNKKIERVLAQEDHLREEKNRQIGYDVIGALTPLPGSHFKEYRELTEKEASLLLFASENELFLEEDLIKACSDLGYDQELLQIMVEEDILKPMTKGEYVELMDYDQIGDGPMPMEVEKSLKEKGYMRELSEKELAFLQEYSEMGSGKDNRLAVSMLGVKYGLNASRRESLLRPPFYSELRDDQRSILEMVEAGKSIEQVADFARKKDFAYRKLLEDRFSFDLISGERKVNYKPEISGAVQFDMRLQTKFKKTIENIDVSKVNISEVRRSDIDLLNSEADKISYLSKLRRQVLAEQILSSQSLKDQLFETLTEQEKAFYLANREELDSFELEKAEKVKALFGAEYLASKKDALISNNEYFFLAAVRRQDKHHVALSQDYKVSLESLKDRGLVDFLSEVEDEIIQSYRFSEKKTSRELTESDLKVLEDLRERHFISNAGKFEGFLRALEEEDKQAAELQNEEKTLRRSSLLQRAEKALISRKELEGLRSRGFVDYLDEEDEKLLQRFKNHPDEVKDSLNEKYGRKRSEQILKRVIPASGEVDLRVRFDLKEKFRNTPRVQYREKESVLKNRLSRPYTADTNITRKDNDLIIRRYLGDDLPFTKIERCLELKLAGKSIDNVYIPSNKDKSFLDQIAYRELDHELFKRIALEDFKIDENTYTSLVEGGFIATFQKKDKNHGEKLETIEKVLPYQELDEIRKARVYVNATPADKKNLEKPSKKVFLLLKDKTKKHPIKPKVGDYELYFVLQRGEKLSKSQQRRIQLLEENGRSKDSANFKNFTNKESNSYRMKGARTSAFLKHYEATQGKVDLKALRHLNTFKQMTASQLNYVGLDDKTIMRYSEGVKEIKNSNLFNKHIAISKEGPIEYFSLNHEGPVSGRKFLERAKVNKKLIAKRPQGRADLIHHDLKVVDAVQKVVEIKKVEGKRLVRVENESMQYSAAKLGSMNHERAGGPSFMDAVLIFEEDIIGPQQAGKEEVVAVEYGNYPTKRMVSKIQSAKFDQAFVYSNQVHQKRYTKHINQQNVIFGVI